MKNLFFFILMGVISGCAAFPPFENADSQERAKLIEAAQKSGNRDFALLIARRHIEENPDDPHAYGIYGQLLLEEGQCREAARLLQRALILEPDILVWERLRVKSALQCRRFEKALQLIRDQERENLDDPAMLNMRGVALDHLGRHDEAQASYRQALVIGANPAATYNLALSLLLSGQNKESLLLLETVQDQDLDNEIDENAILFFESLALAKAGQDARAREKLSLILPPEKIEFLLSHIKR